MRTIMFDLQLKWTVGVGGGGREKRLYSPIPLLFFDRRPAPWYKFISLSSLPLPSKLKMAAITFATSD